MFNPARYADGENPHHQRAVSEWFVRHTFEHFDPLNPKHSVLFVKLTDMPQALFTIGTLDPLLLGDLFMGSRSDLRRVLAKRRLLRE